MSTIDMLANEVFAKLGLKGVEADLTVADREDIPEVDASVIVLGELSLTEIKLLAVVGSAIDAKHVLQQQVTANMLRFVADRMAGGKTVDMGRFVGIELDRSELTALVADNVRQEFVRLDSEKDAASAVMYLSIRQRLGYWGTDLEIRRGGNICIPRNKESN